MESKSELETVNNQHQLGNSWLMEIWRLATCGHGLHRSSNNNNGNKWSKNFYERLHRRRF